jgi:hypothetical protein
MSPRNVLILDPKNGDAVPVEPATGGWRAAPSPLSPDRIACGTYAEYVSLKIRNITENDRPIRAHLVTVAGGEVGMHRLRALIIGRETRYERIDVVPIHGLL